MSKPEMTEAEALAALAWLREAGADEAVEAEALDRLAPAKAAPTTAKTTDVMALSIADFFSSSMALRS